MKFKIRLKRKLIKLTPLPFSEFLIQEKTSSERLPFVVNEKFSDCVVVFFCNKHFRFSIVQKKFGGTNEDVIQTYLGILCVCVCV